MEEHEQQEMVDEMSVRGAPLRRGAGASEAEPMLKPGAQEHAQLSEQMPIRGRSIQGGGGGGAKPEEKAVLKPQEYLRQLEQRPVRAMPDKRGGAAEPEEMQK